MTATTANPAAPAYRVTALAVNEEFRAEAVRLTEAEGLPLTKAAKALGTSPGRVAMALLLTATPVEAYAGPEDLAKKIVEARKAGASWGLLAARYRVTEGTCRAAFTSGAKAPFYAVDYRGWASLAPCPVTEAKARGAKARQEVRLSAEARVSLGQAVEAKARAARARKAQAAKAGKGAAGKPRAASKARPKALTGEAPKGA